nr:small ribosomal subunit protein mS26 isoform X1 [Dasypus novemcinctus]
MLRALSGLGARAPRQPRALLVVPARGRKSRHDPPAKSKAGRVQSPPAVDPAELLVLTERYREYRLTVRALRLEFVAEVRKKVHEARAGVLAERKARENAAEHRELMSWNQAENQRLHELRLARLLQEAREQEQRQAEKKACQAREAQAWAQLKEREVLQLQVGVRVGWRPAPSPWRAGGSQGGRVSQCRGTLATRTESAGEDCGRRGLPGGESRTGRCPSGQQMVSRSLGETLVPQKKFIVSFAGI